MKKSILVPLITVTLTGLLLFGLSGVVDKTEQTARFKTLLPGSHTFQSEPYTGEDANIRSVHKGETGFVIESAAEGYVDEIVLLVGVSKQGEVTGLVVRDMHETAGLGNRAMTDWEFLPQFLGQPGEEVDAITGATVTSKAIARCVRSAVAYVTGTDASSGATSWGG